MLYIYFITKFKQNEEINDTHFLFFLKNNAVIRGNLLQFL